MELLLEQPFAQAGGEAETQHDEEVQDELYGYLVHDLQNLVQTR